MYLKLAKKITRTPLYKWLTDSLVKVQKTDKILLIGSGPGVSDVLKSEELEFVTCDIDIERKPDFIWDITQERFNEEFHFILCVEVMEHVTDPKAAIQNLLKALHPGGTLLITTPFIFEIHDGFDTVRLSEDFFFANITRDQILEFQKVRYNFLYVMILRNISRMRYGWKIFWLPFIPLLYVLSSTLLTMIDKRKIWAHTYIKIKKNNNEIMQEKKL